MALLRQDAIGKITALHRAAPDPGAARDKVQAQLAAFLAGRATSVPRFTFLARDAMWRAHAGRTDPDDLDTVDWQTWRLGLEFRLLEQRCNRSGRALATGSAVSGRLELAYGLALTGREAMVAHLLDPLHAVLPKVVDRIEAGQKTAAQLGTMGAFFHDLTGTRPDHAAFARAPETDIEALAARDTYGRADAPGGALLPGPEGDLLPVEVVYWATRPLREARCDPLWTRIAARMAVTTYPVDSFFQHLDMEITVAGF